MRSIKELQHGKVITLKDTGTGQLCIEDVPVYGHVEEEEYSQAFWEWQRKLPGRLRCLVRGHELVEYGYGLWESDVNSEASEGSFLYAPADFYVPCGHEFPVTMSKSIICETQGVKDFEGVGHSHIFGGFIGTSSYQYIYYAKPERFSHQIIFAPGNRLALVDPQDLSLWDSLWRIHVSSTGTYEGGG